MLLGKLNRVLWGLAGGVLVCGTLWQSVARSGQPGQEDPRTAARPEVRQDAENAPIRKSFTVPAPRQVKAAAGRGEIVAFALDAEGERIPQQVRKKSRNQGAMMGGMMGMMGGGVRKKRTRIRTVFTEEMREVRWAVVTGIIDHRRTQWWYRDGGRRVLKPANEIYCRVELERKTLQKDGSWSAWRSVDAEANLKILDNLTELEAERALEEFRVQNLVDPLPFLKAGEWRGVDVESFVPALDKPAEDPQVAPGKLLARPTCWLATSMRRPRPNPRS